jgi:hypothetical protein
MGRLYHSFVIEVIIVGRMQKRTTEQTMDEIAVSSSLPSKNDRGGDNDDGHRGSQEMTSRAKDNDKDSTTNEGKNDENSRGSNNQNTTTLLRYYVFLRCDNLTAPAIFCSLEDCHKYVGHEIDGKLAINSDDDNVKNKKVPIGAGVEFQTFDNILDAIEYLEPGSLEQWTNKKKENTVPTKTVAGKDTVSQRKLTETVNTTTATPTSLSVTAKEHNTNSNHDEGKLAANQMALAAATAADEMAAAFQSTPILDPAAAAAELAAAFKATPILDPAFAPISPLLASLATAAASVPTAAATTSGLASMKRSADEANLDGTPKRRARGNKRVSFSARSKATTATAATVASPPLRIAVAGQLGSPKNKRGRPRKSDPLAAAQVYAPVGDLSSVTGYLWTPPLYAMTKRDQKWEQFYAELVKYKKDQQSKNNGDFNTKIQGRKYTQLSQWVERTRTHFRALIQETVRLSSGVASADKNDKMIDNKNDKDESEKDQSTKTNPHNPNGETDGDNANSDGVGEKVATSEIPRDDSTKEDDETERDATSEQQKEHNNSQKKDDSADRDAAAEEEEEEEKKIDPTMVQATIIRLHAIDALEAQRLQRLHHLGLTFEKSPTKKVIRKQEHMIKKQYQDEAEEWEERLQELVVFKAKYGHTNVPAKPKSVR